MKQILIVYHSQYKGNTHLLAELVAQGCRQVAGVNVHLVNVYDRRIDLTQVENADGLAIGSADYFSYVGGGLKQFFDDLCIADWAGRSVKGKPYVAFATHGGSDKILPVIDYLAAAMNFDRVAEGVSCEDAPTDKNLQSRAIELGKLLAEHVVSKQQSSAQ